MIVIGTVKTSTLPIFIRACSEITTSRLHYFVQSFLCSE